VAETISNRYNLQIAELSAIPGGQSPQEFMIDKLISLSKEYEGKYGFYTGGTFVEMVNLNTDEEKKDFLSNYTLESLFQMIVTTETYMDSDSIVYLKEYSDDVSSKPELFEAANPEVWNASVYTMRFAAFFRYIKTNYPEGWNAFIDQVQTIDPEPRIVTPTAMYQTGNSEVENALRTASSPFPSANRVLKYYPNPFTDFIVLNNSTEMERVSIFGTDGRLYYQEYNCPNQYRLNTSGLKAGIYFLEVVEKNHSPKTVIIEKK
jgi:hypothetical protein